MGRRYFYHLTDGVCLIIDKKGRWTRSNGHVEELAYSAASKLMQAAPAPLEWSDWLVSVHDQHGSMVAVVPFPQGQG